MKDPLSVDLETIKDFEITENHELEAERKHEYVEAQINEMRFLVWRKRVDLILAAQMKASGNELLEDKADEQIKEARTFIKQLLPAIDVLVTLRNDLPQE